MTWIIVNKYDPELLWSNEYGWVTEDYDSFDERAALHLPIDGEWERLCR
jgi:hypothetical protein